MASSTDPLVHLHSVLKESVAELGKRREQFNRDLVLAAFDQMVRELIDGIVQLTDEVRKGLVALPEAKSLRAIVPEDRKKEPTDA